MKQKLKEWAVSGPYTFKAALELAIECSTRNSRSRTGDASEALAETLNEVVAKFSLEELAKLLNPSSYCTEKQYKHWLNGAGWELRHVPAEFSEEQCELAAKFCNLGEMYGELNIWNLSPRRKVPLVRALRDIQRDRSPERK